MSSAGPDANLCGIELWQVAVGGPGNAPPTVSLSAPADGASFAAGTTVELAATAADSDGQVSKVEFYAGPTKLGEDTSAPYTHSWTNPTSGSHQLTARATDNQTASTTSTSRTITVNAPSGGETLYRAINLGGPSLTIDGRLWEAGTAANVSAGPVSFENQSIGLNPATDSERARMIRSSVWGSSLSTVRLSAVPNGSYHVYLTVWEDTCSTTFDIRLEGALVRSGYQSGSAGRWERLGPWPVTLSDGTLDLDAGPDAEPLRDRALADRHPAATQLPTDGRVDRPAEGASFGQGTPIGLAATAADTDGQVSKVEFYAGQTKLGEDTSGPTRTAGRPPTPEPTSSPPAPSTTRRKHHLHEPHDHRHGHELPAAGRREGGDDHCGGWSRGRPRGNRRRELRADVRGDRVAEPRLARLDRSSGMRTRSPEPGHRPRDVRASGRLRRPGQLLVPRLGRDRNVGFGRRDDQDRPRTQAEVSSRSAISTDRRGRPARTGRPPSPSQSSTRARLSVAGVSVSGTWAAGGSASCTTDATSRCTVTRSGIRQEHGQRPVRRDAAHEDLVQLRPEPQPRLRRRQRRHGESR